MKTAEKVMAGAGLALFLGAVTLLAIKAQAIWGTLTQLFR